MAGTQAANTSTGQQPSRAVSVLFVCLGNICRSTMAEGVFQSLTRPPLAKQNGLISSIDSCGTGAYHEGDSPDARTMSTLAAHGVTTYKHSARQFDASSDFDKFDYIFAMDGSNLSDLERLRQREVKRRGGEAEVGKVMLFGEFGGKDGRRAEEVRDPYYGGDAGFAKAYEQCMRFSKAFLEKLEQGELS